MKNTIWAVFIALFLFPLLGSSQLVLLNQNFDLDNVCLSNSNVPNPTLYPFTTNCYTPWISTHGSPNIQNAVPPFEGTHYVHMYQEHDNTQTITQRGEGIALNFNFMAGETYRISFAARAGNQQIPNSITPLRDLILIPQNNPLPPLSGDNQSNAEIIPVTPANSENIYQIVAVSGQWTMNEVIITPMANYSQLWIRTENVPDNENTPSFLSTFFIDDFTIDICPDNYMVDFHFEHLDGEEDDKFSDCELIMFDGSASSNSTYQRIRLRDLTANTEVVTPWLATLPLNAPFDLPDYIDNFYPNSNVQFLPGHTYEVKLSIYRNTICAWIDEIKTFTIYDEIDCAISSYQYACDAEGTTGYILLDCDGDNHSYEWTFPPNSMPILINDGAGIINASEGNYTVIVSDNCNVKTVYEFTIEQDCCEEIKKCPSPDIYGCDTTIDGNGTESVTFYWEDIDSAIDGYEIQIGINGCCGPGFNLAPITTFQTSYTYTPPWWVECITWTVRSICDEKNEVYSENNQTYCYYTKGNTCKEIETPQLKMDTRSSELDENIEYSVHPNPNDGNNIMVNFTGKPMIELVVEIYSIQGELLETVKGNTDENGYFQKSINPKNDLTNGMYTIMFHSKNGSYSSKLLVVNN